jgi:PAS domain S-box-containing protein
VLETLSDALFVVDREWRFVYLNRRGAELVRRPAEELLGRVLGEAFPQAPGTAFRQGCERAVREGVTTEIEEFYAPLGLWLYVRAFPSPEGLTITMQDVSDRKRAEAEQARLTALLEETVDVVATASPDGVVTYLNRAARRLYGVPERGPVPEMRVGEMYPDGARRRLLEEGIPAAVRDGTWAGESTLLLPDGRELPVSQVIVAHRASGGEVESLSTIIRDITPRIRSETALRASEAELRALVEAFSDVILVLDREGTYCKVAPSAPERLFRPARELVGRRLHDVFPAERADEFLALVHRALDTRQRVESEYSLVIGGATYWFATTVSALPDDDRVVWVARDVTERHRQEEALRESEEMLRQSQKMEAVGRLAGGIAHDFNNLLTVIRGNAEMLLLDLPAGSVLRDDALEVCRAADRAAELTHQLLAFSRRQVVQPRTVSLNRVVGGMDKMLRRIIGEDVELSTELAARADTVRADPGQLEQMVLNLAVNARDAILPGGTIRITTEDVRVAAGAAPAHPGVPDGSYVALAVADDGCGMDEEVLERIFEPFFTTKEQGKGTGLGLSTVYGISRQGGGHVTVRSVPGEGTTFRVLLPCAVAEEEHARSGGAPGTAPPAGAGTVLLVEDEDAVRAFAARVLARCGYRVVEARNGREALNAALRPEEPIDLVLTDVVMPEMSGTELARRVRVVRPDVPVAYMTGYADEDVVRHGALPAGTLLLQKPFTGEALAGLVQEALQRR